MSPAEVDQLRHLETAIADAVAVILNLSPPEKAAQVPDLAELVWRRQQLKKLRAGEVEIEAAA